MTLLDHVLPAGAVGSLRAIADLHGEPRPAELPSVAHAVPKRRREFAAGRAAARLALGRLVGSDGFVGSPHGGSLDARGDRDRAPGSPATEANAPFADHAIALPADEHGVPRWPDGIVGSIAHTDELVAAAVARSSTIAALGIDIETIARVKPEVVEMIAHPDERAFPGALVFAAKEAAYKCQFPITHEVFDFLDVTISIVDDDARDGDASRLAGRVGAFRATFRDGLACAGFAIEGRYAIDATHVVTAAWIAARRDQRRARA